MQFLVKNCLWSKLHNVLEINNIATLNKPVPWNSKRNSDIAVQLTFLYIVCGVLFVGLDLDLFILGADSNQWK